MQQCQSKRNPIAFTLLLVDFHTPPVSIGNTVIDVQSRIVVIQGDRVEFTSKEFDLLCFFAKYPNWALTRGQILDSVWDDSPAATYHAVENTILEQTT